MVAVERHIRRQNFGTALEAVNKIMSKGEVSVLVFAMKAYVQFVSSRCKRLLGPLLRARLQHVACHGSRC